MRYRVPHLMILVVFLLVVPAGAGTCFSESDCPACSIDGMRLVDSKVSAGSLIGAKYPAETLTCRYESEKVTTGNPHVPSLYDSVDVRISCYNNSATASEWKAWLEGTGENPVKDSTDRYAQLYGRKEKEPKCVQELDWKKTGTSAHYTGRGCCCEYSVAGRYLLTFQPHTYYTYQEGNEPVDIRENLLAWDRKYLDCFAGFSPKPTPAAGEKMLHGTVIATKIPYGLEYPLKHGKLRIYDTSTAGGTPLAETTTDDEGAYAFHAGLEKGKRYTIRIELTFSDEKDYFSVYLGTATPENLVVLEDSFTYTDERDLERDIDLDTLWSALGIGGENPVGILYAHSAEVLLFFRSGLHEDIRQNLPVRVIAFVPRESFRSDIKAAYILEPEQSTIAIGPEESGARSEYQPIDREFHEFSHYLMTNAYGGYPASRVSGNVSINNHGGYVNPSTSDSWQEGFATFMSVILAEEYGYSCDGENSFVSIDLPHDAWDYEGKAEEYAVAGVLYDLYDGKSTDAACTERQTSLVGRIADAPAASDEIRQMAAYAYDVSTRPPVTGAAVYSDDDGISIPLPEIWSVLKNRHPDFMSVYQGFVDRYPAKKAQIDAVFVGHGFFIDRDPGNARYDLGEPFRDSNGNGVYDAGEYFVDMVQDPVFNPPTDTPGTASDYQRQWRLSTRKLPGHFVRVNNAVPFYQYTVEFPGTQRSPYSSLVRNRDGMIYIQVPPKDGARITVTPLGVTTGSPLVFTSGQFHENYLTAVKQGYYTSHDFRVSGPIPAPPVTPDFSKGGFGGKQKGLLSDTLLGRTTGRAPIIVPVIIAIISFAIVAYVLKNEL